ncbi:PD-(D/E)XK nuclease family protein [Saccharolobus caldissimus]|uniref:PD-(D/E)XK endonuclease-like domain-containing protein n=1 Tax=Saccharolobus caldissimus TaxID=1702097 RepID=A0AAQ4CNR3_9CREN|nr:PD-(D/E)XK nuclease family protein [Saccharolobus caldissimus]BDB97444.1 hypothetical protein SACC_04610 [Saccharolobus caldissimus]
MSIRDEDISYEEIYDYIDYIDKLNTNEKNLCEENIDILLRSTGHIAKVTNIANGVGYCIYKAKLQEFIGVRDFIVSNTPGKGTDIHKLLGLVSIEMFNQNKPLSLSEMRELIEKAYDDNVDLFADRERKEDYIALAYEMLSSLQNALVNKIYPILNTSFNRLFPVVEQQFHDYEYHILGVPDLILEDKENKKAIVVEWKTYDEQVYDTEKAQVIAYSLLEARRLGYSGKDAVDAITGKWDDIQKTIKDVKVLPLIIRPGIGKGRKLTLQPHPILFSNTKEKFIEFRKLVGKVIVVAGYLTLQLVNPKVFGIDEEEVKEYCKLKIRDKEYSALRLIPLGLRRGNPTKRDKFPCKTGNKPLCPLIEACGFYLGQYKKTPFDIVMWALRYYTLGIRENTSITFKVIYELFRKHRRDDVISNLKNGNGYEWTFPAGPLIRQDKKKQRILIYKDKKIFQQIRVDVIDGIYDSDNFVIYRKIRDYEKNDGKLRVIREGKPVMLFLNDASRIPSLSLNLTARVDRVEIDNDLVKYYINIPSSVFRYSLTLIKKYIEKYPELVKDSLFVETGVDLTSRELMTIDAIQRKLRDDSQKIMEKIEKRIDEKEEAEKIFKKVADDLEKESNNGWDLYQTIDDILPKLISKLNKPGN